MKQRVTQALKWYIPSLILFSLIVFAFPFFHASILLDREDVSTNFPDTRSFHQSVDIDDYKGKVVLVDYWFVGCEPCLKEMRYYPELIKKHKDLVIVSLSVDSPQTTQNLLMYKPKPWDFLTDSNPNWRFYNISKAEKEAANIRQFPTYYLIDKQGAVISSPKSGLFAVEKYMGGIFSIGLSTHKYINTFPYSTEDFIKLFKVYNILFALFFLFFMVVLYLKSRMIKS